MSASCCSTFWFASSGPTALSRIPVRAPSAPCPGRVPATDTYCPTAAEGEVMRVKEHWARPLGVAGAAVLAGMLADAGSAAAQVYPSRTITMIVPFPAGGAGDTVARTMAERMRVSLGQPIVIENVTGASGSIGTGRVARAAPDGYTLGYGGMNTHIINGAVLALQYDVLRDFEPVALMS